MRKLVEKITVYENRFTMEFKLGLKIDVEPWDKFHSYICQTKDL